MFNGRLRTTGLTEPIHLLFELGALICKRIQRETNEEPPRRRLFPGLTSLLLESNVCRPVLSLPFSTAQPSEKICIFSGGRWGLSPAIWLPR